MRALASVQPVSAAGPLPVLLGWLVFSSHPVTKELRHFGWDGQVLDLAGGHHSSNCHPTQVLEAGNLSWSCPKEHTAILRPAYRKHRSPRE